MIRTPTDPDRTARLLARSHVLRHLRHWQRAGGPSRVGAGKTAPGDYASIGPGQTFWTRNQCLDHRLVLIGKQMVVRPTAPEIIVGAVINLPPAAEPAPAVDVETACRFAVDRYR